MNSQEVPSYAVFDDYRHHQRVAVVVRWFVLIAWLFLVNYRASLDGTLVALNTMGGALALLNGYVQWRIWKGQPITLRYVYALSAADLAVITVGFGITDRFDNARFVFYYPALLGMSILVTSRFLSFAIVAMVAAAYAAISMTMDPGVSFSLKEEKVLIARIVAMFAVVAGANLLARIDRDLRREAVEAERAQAERNLELQKQAMDAEMAALAERSRIAREIHDGIAQSIYMLSLNLETCADLAERQPGPLRERLQTLVPLAKQTLLETRHYIYDLKPVLSGQQDLATMAQNQVKEFSTVASIRTNLSVVGQPRRVEPAIAAGLYRMLQEALANILKHAQASEAQVTLSFKAGTVELEVRDNGVGFNAERPGPGYGLDNLRQRAQELSGSCEIVSTSGEGTRVSVTLPAQEVEDEAH